MDSLSVKFEQLSRNYGTDHAVAEILKDVEALFSSLRKELQDSNKEKKRNA